MDLVGNGRGTGVTDAIHAAVDGPVLLLFGLLTQLGDVWFLLLLTGSLYVAGDVFPRWGIDRRRGLFLLALVFTYVALIGALKTTFNLPRPPGAGSPPELAWLPPDLAIVVNSITTAESPGFPSGHALGSTVVWGGLALVLDRGSFRKRLGLAAGLIFLISVSRLVLGVHYLVDVVVGMGLGALALGVLYRLTERGTEPGRALLAGVVVAGVGLFTGITFESVAASGGAVGAWLTWRGVAETTPAHPTTGREVAAGFLSFGAAAVLFVGLLAVEPPIPIAFLGTAAAGGVVVAAPTLGERLA